MIDLSNLKENLKRVATRVALISSFSIIVSLGSTAYIDYKINELEAKIDASTHNAQLWSEMNFDYADQVNTDMQDLQNRMEILEDAQSLHQTEMQPEPIPQPSSNPIEEVAQALGY